MSSEAEVSQLKHDFEKLVQGMNSSDIEEVYECAQKIRKLFSYAGDPPIDDLIALKAVPRLVELLQHNELSNLQYEAAWILTNITAGNTSQTECVVNAGACPHFLCLLRSPDQKVAEQAIWALSNIAGEASHYRDMLINMDILPAIARLVNSNLSPSFLENIAWCLSNFCKYSDSPMSLVALRECLSTMRQLLFRGDRYAVRDVCLCLKYISTESNEIIQDVINLDVIGRLIAILHSSNELAVVKAIVETLGNITAGSNEQTQVVIDHDGLAAFKYVLEHTSLKCPKEVARALSNVTTGSIEQIQAVIDNDLLNHLITLLNSRDEGIRGEATCAISNLACSGTAEQSILIVRGGGFPSLIDMFSSPDSKIKQRVLDACRAILKAASAIKEKEIFCKILDEAETFSSHLKRLEEDKDEEIRDSATRLLQEFFESKDDDYVLLSPFARTSK